MHTILHLGKTCALLSLVLMAMLSCLADIQVQLNGKLLVFSQPPELINGRTMVPMRDIFEALGAKVDWDTDTMTVTATRGATHMQLGIGKTSATVNNQLVTLDAPAMLLNGHTMVPLRFVSESLGADVQWQEATQTVIITTKPVDDSGDNTPVDTTPPAITTITPDEQGAATVPLLSWTELEDLVAPIALYPDPLLAQILPSATFPDQLARANQLVPLRGGNAIIDQQNWDISVKAVSYYPAVLAMLAGKQEWTTAIGQAYVSQPEDLMRAIQQLRAQARDFGYLASNARQQVYLDGDQIRIVPKEATLIYVPQYDSKLVFREQRHGDIANYVTFGHGAQIGVWLNRDMDWQNKKVYYHGWKGNGWVSQSRPHVMVDNHDYVNDTYSVMPVNRNDLVVKIDIGGFILKVKDNTDHVIGTTGNKYGYDDPRSSTAYLLSRHELEDLIAPIALYPDPLLAQILPAATFPDELLRANQLVPLRDGNVIIDDQNWDISVKAVAYYPAVLNGLASKPEWTTAVGQAYISQPEDLMRAIQQLRIECHAYGYLESNDQQQVYFEGGKIRIVPVDPRFIYVPQYDSHVVFEHPRQDNIEAYIHFGDGLRIGVWLNRDMDWQNKRVYYHGWKGSGWVSQSRPNVTINNTTYVNKTYINKPVTVNKTVVTTNITNYIQTVKTNQTHIINRPAGEPAPQPIRTRPNIVTPMADTHGSITPASAQNVNDGGHVTFIASPHTGYEVDSWYQDGKTTPEQVGGARFILTNISTAHTVKVIFKALPGVEPVAPTSFNVTPSAGQNGAITPNSVLHVNVGGRVTFAAAPHPGYLVDGWYLDGTNAPAQIGGLRYTLANITATRTVKVTFKALPGGGGTPTIPRTYEITPSAGANGSITPNYMHRVKAGARVTFTASPDKGFTVDGWYLDGSTTAAQTGGQKFTITNVAAAHTVKVTFK